MQNTNIAQLEPEPLFKTVEFSPKTIKSLVTNFTTQTITAISRFPGGGSKTNYKMTFNNNDKVVLSIYTNPNSISAYSELYYRSFLNNKLPTPGILYSNLDRKEIDYHYIISEYIEGVPMLNLLLENKNTAIYECVEEAGYYLGQLKKINFTHFSHLIDGQVVPFDFATEIYSKMRERLSTQEIKNTLGGVLADSIEKIFDNNRYLLTHPDAANLCHGDYRPANILINEINGRYKIAAIIDWELCHAGSYLVDFSMFTRRINILPPAFEKYFIEGIAATGLILPTNWKKIVNLLNLYTLVWLMTFAQPKNKYPKTNLELVYLIKHNISELEY